MVDLTLTCTLPVFTCRVAATCDRNNGGCEHHCYSTSDTVTCGCAIGFTLGTDGTSCLSGGSTCAKDLLNGSHEIYVTVALCMNDNNDDSNNGGYRELSSAFILGIVIQIPSIVLL